MKNILCYGDSNTYGFNPKNGTRYSSDIRWTAVLQNLLKDKYKVINEGCNNRVGFLDSIDGFKQTAKKHFPELISAGMPIDILVLALGTNDIQFLYDLKESDIKNGLTFLIEQFKKYNKDSVVIIIPPVKIDETILNGYFACQFDKTSIEKSKKYYNLYQKMSEELNCSYIDINNFVTPSKIDGLHYDEKSHKIIANVIYNFILNDYYKKVL